MICSIINTNGIIRYRPFKIKINIGSCLIFFLRVNVDPLIFSIGWVSLSEISMSLSLSMSFFCLCFCPCFCHCLCHCHCLVMKVDPLIFSIGWVALSELGICAVFILHRKIPNSTNASPGKNYSAFFKIISCQKFMLSCFSLGVHIPISDNLTVLVWS